MSWQARATTYIMESYQQLTQEVYSYLTQNRQARESFTRFRKNHRNVLTTLSNDISRFLQRLYDLESDGFRIDDVMAQAERFQTEIDQYYDSLSEYARREITDNLIEEVEENFNRFEREFEYLQSDFSSSSVARNRTLEGEMQDMDERLNTLANHISQIEIASARPPEEVIDDLQSFKRQSKLSEQSRPDFAQGADEDLQSATQELVNLIEGGRTDPQTLANALNHFQSSAESIVEWRRRWNKQPY